MLLDTQEKIKAFKEHGFPVFKPLEKHPNSLSGTKQKLDKIKEMGGYIFKRGKETYFFTERQIMLGSPHRMNKTEKGNWYAAYLIPEAFRV